MKAPKRPSSYRGVGWNHGRWGAFIKAGGRSQWFGTYDTEEAAARAYDEKAKQVSDNPILNFLPDGSLNPDRKERKSHLQPVKERRQEMVMNLLYLKYRLRYATPPLPTFTGGD